MKRICIHINTDPENIDTESIDSNKIKGYSPKKEGPVERHVVRVDQRGAVLVPDSCQELVENGS